MTYVYRVLPADTMKVVALFMVLIVLSERESQPEEDSSVSARLSRLETQYEETGIRRSVDAVMVVLVSLVASHRVDAE